MLLKVPLVLHTDYGGFSLTAEMVRRLQERKVEWVSQCEICSDETYWVPDNEERRVDPDLIAVVRELTKEVKATLDREDLSWAEEETLKRDMLANLQVAEVCVNLDINSYDGRESVTVTGYTGYPDEDDD